MSWLPSSLSNLTGQISNFTKDVLTEGTEEIHDHATELRVIKARYAELEEVSMAQRTELKRLKHLNEELTVQVQTQELQIRTNSDQYRAAMEMKEKEIKSLRQSHAELYNDHVSRSSPALSLSQHDTSGGFVDGRSDEDFDDVISSQHTINRLSSEVRRLETELQHWRSQISTQFSVGSNDAQPGGGVAELHAQINDLQQQLSNSFNSHQCAISVLEDKHRQTLVALKRTHKEEMEKIQQANQSISASAEDAAGVQGELSRLRNKVEDLEGKNKKLECDLEHMHAADRRKALVVDELTAELTTSKHDAAKLLERSENESGYLQHELDGYKRRCQELERDLAHPQHRRKVQEADETSSYEELTAHTLHMNGQVEELTSKIEEYEQELEQFNLVKSDWQMEKKSLEDTLLRLRQELHIKDEALCVAQARKRKVGAEARVKGRGTGTHGNTPSDGTSEALMEMKQRRRHPDNLATEEVEDESEEEEEDDDIESHVHRLNDKIGELMSGSASLEMERDQLKLDKAHLCEELKSKDSTLADLSSRLSAAEQQISAISSVSGKLDEKQVEENQNKLNATVIRLTERERELDNALAEKTSLEKSLEELDMQHEAALAQVIASRNEHSKASESVQRRITELESQLSDANVREAKIDSQFQLSTKKEQELRISVMTLEAALKDTEQRCSEAELHAENIRNELKRELVDKSKQMELQCNEFQVTIAGLEMQLHTLTENESVLSQKIATLENEASIASHNAPACEQYASLGAKISQLADENNAMISNNKQDTIYLLSSNSEYKDNTEVVESLRLEIETLKERLDEVEAEAKLYETEVERLAPIEEKHAALVEANKRLLTDIAMLKSERNGDVEKRDTSPFNHTTIIENGVATTNNRDHANGAVGIDGGNGEISRLKLQISRQDELIMTLNGKCSSMLRLLEERSISANGNTVLADYHRLEVEAATLRKEKEQMISVLNEKTREASSLKSEVHTLMSAVSAGKAALAKLQADSREMARCQEVAGPHEDMKQDAIKRLSQLIKDKDFEIDALTQKNATLLEVMHESAPDTSTVIRERDDAIHQLALYRTDREQLISALNAKHLESVSYYNEAQRLNGVVAELTATAERLERDHRLMSTAYEDKQKSLVRALNEVAMYRRQNQNEASSSIAAATMMLNEDVNNESDISSDRLVGASSSRLYDDLFAEKDRLIAEKDSVIRSRDQSLNKRDQLLAERDQQLTQFGARLRDIEQTLNSRESELNTTRKQCDALLFKVHDLETAVADTRREREELEKRCESLTAETRSLNDRNSALTVQSNTSDYELSALRQRVSSMEVVLQSRTSSSLPPHDDNTVESRLDSVESGKMTGGQGNGSSEMEALLRAELDELRRRCQSLLAERDQLVIAVQRLQSDCIGLSDEVQRLHEKEQRQMRECERLRAHLVHIEEGYTRELLEAEEREKQLRTKLGSAEEKLMSSAATVNNVRSESSRHVDSLQIQLHAMAEQRDNAMLQLSSAQETIASYSSSLANLQMVLEQFQAERQQAQTAELERCRRELEKEHQECIQLQKQMKQLQSELEEAREALNAAHRLSEQLDKKEEMVSAMREEVLLRETELAKCEQKLRELTSSTDAKVDKIIIKNLLVGYFHTPPDKRQEVFQIISQVLSFNREEMEQIMASSQSSGWISGLFNRKKSIAPVPASPAPRATDRSFSELFVNFLERESTPQPQARLPAERMIAEQQQKQQLQHQQQQLSKPAFNPFATTMHSYSPSPTPTRSASDSPSSSRWGAVSDESYHSNLVVIRDSASNISTNSLFNMPELSGAQGNALFGSKGIDNPLFSSTQQQRQHPLFGPPPVPTNMPIFAPLSDAVITQDAVAATNDNAESLRSGRSSASNSGRSTPSSSRTILRDVLQQPSSFHS